MPSKEAVTLVSYRKIHTDVVPAGESKQTVGGHCDDNSAPLWTLRNRSVPAKSCPRVPSQKCVSLMHSSNTDKSPHPANQPSTSDAACISCHGNKQITCSNHDERINESCGEGVVKVNVKKSDARDTTLCERSVSGVDECSVVSMDKGLECQRCDLGVDRERRTETNGHVNTVVSLDVDADNEHVSTGSAISDGDAQDSAVLEGGGSDNTLSGDVVSDSTVSEGGDQNNASHTQSEVDVKLVRETGNVDFADLSFVNDTVYDDSNSRIAGAVCGVSRVKLDTIREVAEVEVRAVGGGVQTSTDPTDGDTSANLYDRRLKHDALMQDLLSSVPLDDSRDGPRNVSCDDLLHGWGRRPGRRRRSQVKIDLHHGLRCDRGDSDDDGDSFTRNLNLGPFHVSDDDDDDDFLFDYPFPILRYIDDDDDYATGSSLTASEPDLTPPFAVGELLNAECSICLDTRSLHVRACCAYAACDDCLARYYTAQVRAACIRVRCVGCDEHVPRDEIIFRLDDDAKRLFDRFLVDANRDPRVKTCPRCSVTTHLNADAQLGQPEGLRVTCTDCHLDWCFPCQAPWHEGATCRQYRKGNKLLKTWARQQQRGQVNAQKCPRCKTYIQRTTGCDHMTCTQCHTDFCYACGGRYYRLKYLGSHHSRLSILGCRKNFKPNKPVQRRLIRGTLFGLNVLSLPILAALAVGAGAVVAGAGVVALPVYGSYRLHKHLQQKKALKQKEERRQQWAKSCLTSDWRRDRVFITPVGIIRNTTVMTPDDARPEVTLPDLLEMDDAAVSSDAVSCDVASCDAVSYDSASSQAVSPENVLWESVSGSADSCDATSCCDV